MFSFDKRYLYIFVAIMVVYNLGGYIQNPSKLLSLLLALPAVIIAMTFHEFAHAFTADKLGDETPRNQGRVTLNPLKHIEPIGFVMLLFAGFGWGRPVQINPVRFKRNISMSKGEAIVSFAGPFMNLILAVIFSFVLGFIFKFNLLANVSSTYSSIIIILLYQIIFMNIGLGVFNLIPLPPLDGSKILRYFMSTKAQMWLDRNQHIFYIIFIAIWVLGLAGVIISPIIRIIAKGIMLLVSGTLGIDLTLLLMLLGIYI